jgi:hypothetical protein
MWFRTDGQRRAQTKFYIQRARLALAQRSRWAMHWVRRTVVWQAKSHKRRRRRGKRAGRACQVLEWTAWPDTMSRARLAL